MSDINESEVLGNYEIVGRPDTMGASTLAGVRLGNASILRRRMTPRTELGRTRLGANPPSTHLGRMPRMASA